MQIRARPWLIHLRVSVQIRARQWLVYPPFSAQGILIWAQVVDIVVNYISVFPCSSVQFSGLPIPLSARCVVASAIVVDLCCLGCCNHISPYLRVSVPIRAHPWLIHLPPRAPSPSTHSRYIPNTYPTHTRYIRISHEYPTNTLRIPHEYPTQKTAMREVEFSSPLAVLCTAVARRVFHASVRMVR